MSAAGVRFLSVSPRLPVRDLDRAIAFYRDLLGFEAGDPWPEDAPSFVILSRDTVHLQFYVPPDADEPCGHGTISIDVDDAAAMAESLRGHVAFEWGPEVYWYGRREFSFRDPEGYSILLSSETGDVPDCA